MTKGATTTAVIVLALVAGIGVAALELASDHQEPQALWAVAMPLIGWAYVGVGLYAWHRRLESRIGVLMVVMGLAWFVTALEGANAPLPYTVGLVAGGAWGALFLHLGVSFPTGRLTWPHARALAIAGYLIFPLAFVPALLVSGPSDLGCDDCPANVLLIERDPDLALAATMLGLGLYLTLFVVVLGWAVWRWRRTAPLERLQLTPVYTFSLATFLLSIVARGGAGAALWAAFIVAGVMPFAFLGGLLRSHVVQLDDELRARLNELRASRVRLVEAGDAARRRLERDLHDGAQARLVALALLLRRTRARASGNPELEALLDEAQEELQTSLAELRELARGIHPAVLTDRGLEPALQALASRAPVPVTVAADVDDRLPDAIESAAYFVVSEALTNVAKYAQATQATVEVQRVDGRVIVDVTDDGVGGADVATGSGLRGLADRLAALDGTLRLVSPAGGGTRLHAEIPFGV